MTLLAGRYRLQEVLGRGGMGEVRRAYDERLARPVAVKTLLANDLPLQEVDAFVARFLREARSAAALNHPNVVAVYDVGEHEGSPFVVMELLDGRTLRSYVGDAAVDLATRVAWLADVARALEAAHASGIVHRDIKPDNVMIRLDGSVKVLDFGIARRDAAHTNATDAVPLTLEGSVVGTPAYMAPEQLRSEPIDARADQFAWGVTAYEVVAGVVPWTGSSSFSSVVASVLTEAARPLRARQPATPASLEAIVMRALEKDRRARFESMTALLHALSGERPAPRITPASSTMAAAPTQLAATPNRVGVSAIESPTRRITDVRYARTDKPEALAAYRAGLALMRSCDWSRAFGELARALAIDADFPSARLRHAIASAFNLKADPTEYRQRLEEVGRIRERLTDHERALLWIVEPVLMCDPPDFAEQIRRVDAAEIEFAGDAEVLWMGANVTLPTDPVRARRLAQRAVEIDSEFSDALQVVGSAAAELGERDVARAAFDRCIELSPNAGDALWERGLLRARHGDAKGAEADVRRAVGIARGVQQLTLLLGAVHARGARASALRSVADSLVAQWPAATRSIFEARLLASLALLHGDLAQCEKELRRGLDLCAAQGSESTHALVYGLALQLAIEQGDVARAGDLAIAYIDARELLTRAAQGQSSSFPLALAAAVHAGRMDAETALRERVAWFEEYRGYGPGLCWGLAFADADDEASREAARRLRPPPTTFWLHRQAMFSDDVGRTALLVGDDELAFEHLAAAARTCLAPSEPVRSTRANLLWGKLLEARGRHDEAKNAYRMVKARWGGTSLATAIEADERLARGGEAELPPKDPAK